MDIEPVEYKRYDYNNSIIVNNSGKSNIIIKTKSGREFELDELIDHMEKILDVEIGKK